MEWAPKNAGGGGGGEGRYLLDGFAQLLGIGSELVAFVVDVLAVDHDQVKVTVELAQGQFQAGLESGQSFWLEEPSAVLGQSTLKMQKVNE